ncbi:MAG: arginase family protein [Phycisphaerales bacterium]
MTGERRLPHLDLCVADWQGWGADTRPQRGALRVRDRLAGDGRGFTSVAIPGAPPARVEDGVVERSGMRRVIQATRETLDIARPRTVFSVLGTCAAEIGPVGWLAEHDAAVNSSTARTPSASSPNANATSQLGALWLDGHADLNAPAGSPSGRLHGMPLRTLLGDGDPAFRGFVPRPLDPSRVVLAGARDLDPAEAQFILEQQMTVIEPPQMADPSTVVDALKAGGVERLYVHLDLDVLDPEAMAHQLVPITASRGVSVGELTRVLDAVGDAFEIVGASLVEFSPQPEASEASVEAALDVVQQIADVICPGAWAQDRPSS